MFSPREEHEPVGRSQLPPGAFWPCHTGPTGGQFLCRGLNEVGRGHSTTCSETRAVQYSICSKQLWGWFITVHELDELRPGTLNKSEVIPRAADWICFTAEPLKVRILHLQRISSPFASLTTLTNTSYSPWRRWLLSKADLSYYPTQPTAVVDCVCVCVFPGIKALSLAVHDEITGAEQLRTIPLMFLLKKQRAGEANVKESHKKLYVTCRDSTETPHYSQAANTQLCWGLDYSLL